MLHGYRVGRRPTAGGNHSTYGDLGVHEVGFTGADQGGLIEQKPTRSRNLNEHGSLFASRGPRPNLN